MPFAIKKSPLTKATIALALTLGVASSVQAQDARVELGDLNCEVSPSDGWIAIKQKRDLTCKFSSSREGVPSETYIGTIERYGLSLGKTTKGTMGWIVLAPTGNPYASGALAGNYGGVSAQATAGVGAEGNILVGGFDNSFSLQPLSVGVQAGANLALGVGALKLRVAE